MNRCVEEQMAGINYGKKNIYKENFMICKVFEKFKLHEGIVFEPEVVSGKENFTYYVSK